MWLAYFVLVVLIFLCAANSGLLSLLWHYDVTGLSTAIFLVWLLAEAVGASQLLSVDRAIAEGSRQLTPGSVDSEALWHRHSFVFFSSELIVAGGIFGTVVGVIIALMPFFGLTTFDISTIQPHLLGMFNGIAVAFFPTAVSIVAKISLDIHSRIHQSAVLTLLAQRNKVR